MYKLNHFLSHFVVPHLIKENGLIIPMLGRSILSDFFIQSLLSSNYLGGVYFLVFWWPNLVQHKIFIKFIAYLCGVSY